MKTIYLLIILQITSGAFFKDAIKVIKEHPKFEETQEVD